MDPSDKKRATDHAAAATLTKCARRWLRCTLLPAMEPHCVRVSFDQAPAALVRRAHDVLYWYKTSDGLHG